MNLDPNLSNPDRIASLVVGVAAVGYAFVSIEQTWAKGVLIVIGLLLAIGGVGGT